MKKHNLRAIDGIPTAVAAEIENTQLTASWEESPPSPLSCATTPPPWEHDSSSSPRSDSPADHSPLPGDVPISCFSPPTPSPPIPSQGYNPPLNQEGNSLLTPGDVPGNSADQTDAQILHEIDELTAYNKSNENRDIASAQKKNEKKNQKKIQITSPYSTTPGKSSPAPVRDLSNVTPAKGPVKRIKFAPLARDRNPQASLTSGVSQASSFAAFAPGPHAPLIMAGNLQSELARVQADRAGVTSQAEPGGGEHALTSERLDGAETQTPSDGGPIQFHMQENYRNDAAIDDDTQPSFHVVREKPMETTLKMYRLVSRRMKEKSFYKHRYIAYRHKIAIGLTVSKYMDSFKPGNVSPEELKKKVDEVRKLLIPKCRAHMSDSPPRRRTQSSQGHDAQPINVDALIRAIAEPPPGDTTTAEGQKTHTRKWTTLDERRLIQMWWSVLGRETAEGRKAGLTEFLDAICIYQPNPKAWKEIARKRFRDERDRWLRRFKGAPYHAETAHDLRGVAAGATERTWGPKKLFDKDPALQFHLIQQTLKRRSPEQTEGQFKNMTAEQRGTARAFAASTAREWLEDEADRGSILHVFLPRQGKNVGKKRDRQPKPQPSKSTIRNATPIARRPWYINARISPGHWEADCMVGAKQSGVVLALVERYTGKLFAFLMQRKKSAVVMHLIQKVAGKHKIITITFDRGSEFAFHDLLTEIKSYFCDPGCPNQKGLVENRIGKMRYSIMSGMDFSDLTQEILQEIVDNINDEYLFNRGFKPAERLKCILRELSRRQE